MSRSLLSSSVCEHECLCSAASRRPIAPPLAVRAPLPLPPWLAQGESEVNPKFNSPSWRARKARRPVA